jgi:hypothetical protein
LDLFDQESKVLRDLFAEWARTRPEAVDADRGQQAAARWDNGTLGKLVLEHGSVRLGAGQEIARVLRHGGNGEAARALSENDESCRRLLDRLDEMSRGVNPVSLAASTDYTAAIEELYQLLQPELEGPATAVSPGQLAKALGDARADLRTADYVRKHAPSHPGPARWYDGVPLLLRLRTAYDRSRGFPWAESAPLASTEVAARYDQEAERT